MLELWTNFIKYLDPTPPHHPSEVLENVSWTQVLIKSNPTLPLSEVLGNDL